MLELIGKCVCVDWRSTEYDWHWFSVLEYDGLSGFLKLQGVDNDGAVYEGGPMWANLDAIDIISQEDENEC